MNFKTSKITSRDLGPNGRDYAVALITAEGEHVVVSGLDYDTAGTVAAIPEMLKALDEVRQRLEIQKTASDFAMNYEFLLVNRALKKAGVK